MTDKTKAYRVVGIDLDIDGERVPEGSEIELVAEPSPKLARYLELLGTVEPSNPEKPTKPEAPAKAEKPTKPEAPAKAEKPTKPAAPAKAEKPAADASATGDNQGNEGDDKKAADNAEENKA
ncbi:hypothetical protein [Pseudomonas sp. TMP9]|uniref:hypothetical protein n=1 Tax=Pseudomonas sp. TMP9 TaxID=3133144 RepID=UPI0030CAFF4F